MTEATAALDVRGMSVSYQGPGGYSVVEDVSLAIQPGETLGVVGESGCGKSTLARAIMRLKTIQAGEIAVAGIPTTTISGRALRGARRNFQMVFQDPFGSLDSKMSVRDIVEQPLRVHRIGDKAERRTKVERMLDDLGLGTRFWERTPRHLSGGQRQRVAIARAVILEPKVVVLDEPISALDVSVQAQVLNLLAEQQEKLDTAYLFIVHDLSTAEYFCDRIVVLYLGSIVETGSATEIFARPQHPYTTALLSAAPVPGRSTRNRIVLRGEPQAVRPDRGCPFAPRCPIGRDRVICSEKAPPLQSKSETNAVACHFPGELGTESVPRATTGS